jgi:hypothetical protein
MLQTARQTINSKLHTFMEKETSKRNVKVVGEKTSASYRSDGKRGRDHIKGRPACRARCSRRGSVGIGNLYNFTISHPRKQIEMKEDEINLRKAEAWARRSRYPYFSTSHQLGSSLHAL